MNYEEKESKIINGVKYTFRRYSESQEFKCDRCNKIKKSKIVVAGENGTELCNACYGNLLSK